MSSQSSGRQRINMEEYSAEEEALSIISEAADIRLAAKKAFMVEAKEIRSKEMEKQQKESGSEQDDICNDSTHDAAAVKTDVGELEKKYKTAMVNSAQLNNENQSLVYQVELLKDQMEELDEAHTELQRHYKEKCRESDFQKRDLQSLGKDLNVLKQQLEITSKLLAESGLIILVNEKGEPVLEKSSQVKLSNNNTVFLGNVALASTESHSLLKKTEEKTCDTAAVAAKKSADSVQVSNSVDEVDGSAFAKVSDDSKDGADRITLNDSSIAIASTPVSCENEVVNVGLTQGVEGDRISLGSKSLVTQSDIDSECQDTDNSSLIVGNSVGAHEASSRLEAEPDNVLAEDDVDEFFDAVSTPSPSSKTVSYDEPGVYDQNELTSEGSSVDPEIRIKEAPSHTSTELRQSITLDNVTETESSTDVIDESEAHVDEENIPGAECNTDITNQNKNVDSSKEIIEVKEEQTVLLETSDSNQTEIGDFPNEKPASADNLVEEAIPEDKPGEEGNLGTGVIHINKDSQEVFCDILQDVVPVDAVASPEEEVMDEQNKSDITQPLSCEVPDSTAVNLESNVCVPCLSEETPQVSADRQDIDVTAEEKGDTESDTLSAEGASDVNDTQDVGQEASIDESLVYDSQNISSEKGNEEPNVPGTTEILPHDAFEKPDTENKTDTEADIGEQSSKSILNTETENKDEENLVCNDIIETGDSRVASLEEEDASCSIEHTNNNTEENECEDDTDFPVKDSSKLAVRTTSVGGSEASEGAVVDDYDLDDIDDVLSTDAPSHSGADLNTAPSSEAVATEPLVHENKSNANSPGKIDEDKEGGAKAKGSKKSKKTGKKSHSEKAEKSKSGEKESKDKAEKTKSKEKPEKSRSSKKESSHEKKTEKSKNKKDVAQDNRSESVSGEEDKHSIAESQTSLEPDDLERALDKQMLESEKLKSPKKSTKKLSIFKKVFK
ncbi:unnamed protein product [Candidula unifasciata]|uniref:Uncharacterized protein n=1 Tax=Candidula unifasciata TaxID=100452 RepID=A0A8S3ZWG2_9EUPU|nr:unnamed protein product [Candidula unifasciata]